eukprot:s3252_g16.t2
MAPRVLRGLVAFGFLSGPSFVSGPRQPSIRVLRRAGDPAAEEVEERHLPLPEATHFVEEEAAGCIEEGCTVEDIMRIQNKLETDEGRIREAIEMLQAARDSFSVDSSSGIGLLRMSLSRIHSLNNKLQALISSQGEQGEQVAKAPPPSALRLRASQAQTSDHLRRDLASPAVWGLPRLRPRRHWRLLEPEQVTPSGLKASSSGWEDMYKAETVHRAEVHL